MSESPLSLAPIDLSKVETNDAPFGRNKDGSPARKRGRPAGWKKPTQSDLLNSDPEARELVESLVKEVASADELADLLAATFAVPAALVDESFDLTDKDGNPNQRCKIAAKRLYPAVKKYGTASFAKWMPEILAVWGIIELAKPAVGPVMEIVAGVRQPLMFRNPEQVVTTSLQVETDTKSG